MTLCQIKLNPLCDSDVCILVAEVMAQEILKALFYYLMDI